MAIRALASSARVQAGWADPVDSFPRRHIGVPAEDEAAMLATIGVSTMSELIGKTIPTHLLFEPEERDALTETELLAEMQALADKNEIFRSYLGQGYYNCNVPTVIKRCVLENPGWYTQYTPYQAEISQGRMESLFNFQTMICELTGLEIANASLLDEATAAGEAMSMCYEAARRKKTSFYVDENCHAATIDLLQSRAEPLGIEVVVGSVHDADFSAGNFCGVIFQYPNTYGKVDAFDSVVATAKAAKVHTVCATDLLALTKLRAPGEFGVDIAIGCAQRFGVPLGYGGPHAAFMSTSKKHMRRMPGRIIGLTRGAAEEEQAGAPVFRLALQTREQHIRRGKATSNVCTAQALLANMAALYGIYHGPEGLKQIAGRVHGLTVALATAVKKSTAHSVDEDVFFDTIAVTLGDGATADEVLAAAAAKRINLRKIDDSTVGISLDETSTAGDLADLMEVLGGSPAALVLDVFGAEPPSKLGDHARTSAFMTQPIFNTLHSETDMMRYIKHLENKDLSLCHDMIPLGSCTMKLNSAVEMQGVTMPGFANIHPFAPPEQAAGYHEMFTELKEWLCECTGYDDMSLQPNSGAQGELAGLMAIRAYHASRGESHRNICVIPVSAHGTNPASAAMAGMEIVEIKVDAQGEVDMEDLRDQCEKHSDNLAAAMITYPSTFGVFEEGVSELCELIHSHGGQVYLDGANMNANVNVCRPGDAGADVSHLNLHKTFCIPHGGGGPGMGPIGVKAHLAPFMPTHVTSDEEQLYSISGAPYGSSLISTISWAYCRMMGSAGLRRASEVAILNANYMAARLGEHFPIRFVGRNGFVAHEFIIDAAGFKETAEIDVTDIAKRLQDFGLHAPTMSWPVANALMIEPTESESKATLDRYCDALLKIREEIRDVEDGKMPRDDNMLKNAPHTLTMITSDKWTHPYTREEATFPIVIPGRSKFWPSVSRADDVFGDKNVVSTLPMTSSK